MRNIAAGEGHATIAAGAYLRELDGLARKPWMVHRICGLSQSWGSSNDLAGLVYVTRLGNFHRKTHGTQFWSEGRLR
jgi:hypothetical protein